MLSYILSCWRTVRYAIETHILAYSLDDLILTDDRTVSYIEVVYANGERERWEDILKDFHPELPELKLNRHGMLYQKHRGKWKELGFVQSMTVRYSYPEGP